MFTEDLCEREMKRLVTSLCVVIILGFSDTHAQQNIVTWKNDPTYSVNNYKHPNKAAIAKKMQPQHGVQIIMPDKQIYVEPVRVIFPDRKIVATQKTGEGKTKAQLAIRRKASEKQQFESID